MSMTIEITPFCKVLGVRASGVFTLDEAKRTFLEIVAALDVNQSEKVLMDGSAVSGDPTLIERFYYGEFVADSVKQSKQSGMRMADPQFAYVLHRPVLDPLRLGETVAVNRGMNLRAFEDFDEAVRWLDLAPDEIKELTKSSAESELR